MKHKTKTTLFKILDILPSRLGYSLYHKVQNLSYIKSMGKIMQTSESTFNQLLKICDELKIDLKDKTILEIGSGWLPIIPYFFKYRAKVKQVHTYDINEHYQKKLILKFNSVFSKAYGYEISADANNKYSLPSGIDYYPSKDVTNEDTPKAEIVFSRFVMSHVPPEGIYEMHKKLKNTLDKGTFIVHFISPSDLNGNIANSISMQDFLKYSKEEWREKCTKFDYHNRLRLPEFLEIFKAAGLEVAYLSYKSAEPGTPKYKLFKELKLHEDYKKYSDEELTAGNIVIVLKV
jgi:hypothetical protein